MSLSECPKCGGRIPLGPLASNQCEQCGTDVFPHLEDETESQIEAVMFVDKGNPPGTGSIPGDTNWTAFPKSTGLFISTIPTDYDSMLAMADKAEQSRFLEREGEMQEAREVAFCKGMLAGGVIALTVLTVTLWLVGVI